MRPKTGRYQSPAAADAADIRLELFRTGTPGAAALVSGDVVDGNRTISFYSAPRAAGARVALTHNGAGAQLDADVRFGDLHFESGTWGSASLRFDSATSGELQLRCPRGRQKCDLRIPLTWRDRYFRDLTIELDLSPVAAFPQRVNWRGVRWTLQKIFGTAGFRTRVLLNQRNVVEDANGWSPGELHAAMRQYRRPELSPWFVHVLLVSRLDEPNWHETYGWMYDESGRRGPAREGCAVFIDPLRRDFRGATFQRELLATIAHEVGHALNLIHSFEKERRDSPSLMNYPQEFPGGSRSYYRSFNFGFDTLELQHLRHNTPRAVEPGRPGGVPYGVYSRRRAEQRARRAARALPAARAAGTPQRRFQDQVDTHLTLALDVADTTLLPGEPVVARVRLEKKPRSKGAVRVRGALDWRTGEVAVEMRPVGTAEWIVHAPPVRRCARPRERMIRAGSSLDAELQIVRTQAGDLFARPGHYELRVRLTLRRGNQRAELASAPQLIQVRAAADENERSLQRIFARADVKQFLILRGSPVPTAAAAAAEELVRRAPQRACAQYAAIACVEQRIAVASPRMPELIARAAAAPLTPARRRALRRSEPIAAAPPRGAGDVDALLRVAAGGAAGQHLAASIARLQKRLG